MRFNGAPAGGGYAADVGTRTTLSLLADTVSSECLKGTAKQTVLDAGVLYALYVVEPSGYSLQINGYLESAPALVPTWNFTLCGQGYCSSSLGDGIHRWDPPRDPAPTNPTSGI